MLRKLITIVLPIVLPFVVYWIALKLDQRRRAEGEVPRWEKTPWVLLSLCAAVLLCASLFWFRTHSGVLPGTKLVPPSLVNGQIVPSHQAE
jgi:hypothetical protein